MCRLENIVKKHGEFKLSDKKSEEEFDNGSGGIASTVVFVPLFVTATVLVCIKFSSKPITMEVSGGCSTALCPALL